VSCDSSPSGPSGHRSVGWADRAADGHALMETDGGDRAGPSPGEYNSHGLTNYMSRFVRSVRKGCGRGQTEADGHRAMPDAPAPRASPPSVLCCSDGSSVRPQPCEAACHES
jgi:hypothetical protein